MLALLALVTVASARPEETWSTLPLDGIRCHVLNSRDEGLCHTVQDWASTERDALAAAGFATPPPDGDEGGDELFDIYLSAADDPGVFCDGDCADVTPDDGLASAATYAVLDPTQNTSSLARATLEAVARAATMATDFAETSDVLRTATASSAAMWVDGASPDAAGVSDFETRPWLSPLLQGDDWLAENMGVVTRYDRGAAIWVAWYADGDPRRVGELWRALAQDGAGDEPDVLDALDTTDGDWRASLLAFQGDRALLGTPTPPSWAPWGTSMGWAWREGQILSLPSAVTPTRSPFPMGVSYWDVSVVAGEALTFEVDGDPDVRWGLVAVHGASVGAVQGDRLDWLDADGGVMTVGVVNLGRDDLDAESPLAPASFTLTVRPTRAAPDPGPTTALPCGCQSTSGGDVVLLLPALLFVRRVSASRGAASPAARTAGAPRG